MKNETENKPKKIKKPKGPIRWEAIVPVTIIVLVMVLYFHFLFDLHLRKTMEWVGYQVVGAEVDVEKLETSFFKASLRIQGVNITDADQPKQNSISIGDIRFSMLWDALLRAKIVVNEVAVEQIEFNKIRKTPGKVKPPEPVTPEKDSAMSKEAEKVKGLALNQIEKKGEDNVLGDIVAMLGGSSSDMQLEKLNQSLISKEKAKALEADFQKKQTAWQERIKQLPQGKDFQMLGDRLGKVKTSNFKSPQELQDSLKEIDSILKEGDAKLKVVQTANSDFNTDLKGAQDGLKDLDAQIKADIKDLEKHFKIPKIDAKSISMSVFKKYLAPYMEKVNKYKAMYEKYAPPNLIKKKDGSNEEPEIAIQPRPRSKGVTYEFGRPNSYPLFWLKKTSISSQAGASPYSGDIKGQITDITSNQVLTGKPTVIDIAGDFPPQNIRGTDLKIVLNNTTSVSKADLTFKVGSYPLAEKEFVQSPDVKIGFKKAQGSLLVNAHLEAYKDLKMKLDNQFKNIDYDVSSKDAVADSILKNVFAGIPQVSLVAEANGLLPHINFDIESNLGSELQKGFQKQIQLKIDEARKKIEQYVQKEIAQHKEKIEGQINQLKSQVEKELKKVQDQAEAQKKAAESKTDQAKKDAENQGKKKLEEEGKKAVDDLKKKFGL
ncbi:MAG: TIGR03545 family protein [Bdellovibrionota bacterium]